MNKTKNDITKKYFLINEIMLYHSGGLTEKINIKTITRVFFIIFARIRISIYLCMVFYPTKTGKIMTTKLTLTIDQQVIVRAKNYAKNKGRSLSDIIENYLRVITVEETNNDTEIAPITKSLKGSFRQPRDFSYKRQLEKQLTEKYLK